MTAPILPISAPSSVTPIGPAGAARGSGSFSDVFSSAVRTVEGIGQDASASAQKFLSGEGEEVHTTVLAAERAELAFDLFMQARNKVVNAYQEIMRMQV